MHTKNLLALVLISSVFFLLLSPVNSKVHGDHGKAPVNSPPPPPAKPTPPTTTSTSTTTTTTTTDNHFCTPRNTQKRPVCPGESSNGKGVRIRNRKAKMLYEVYSSSSEYEDLLCLENKENITDLPAKSRLVYYTPSSLSTNTDNSGDRGFHFQEETPPFMLALDGRYRASEPVEFPLNKP